ncbi:MAG: polyprenyl synthetase family protein [Pseudomonadota bacterium]
MTALPDDPFADWRARCEARLDSALPAATHSRLAAAMRYSLLGGGKRIRPCLVYAAACATGDPAAATDRAAAAVEMIHAYSLIHDDLPAMDDDDLRRGRPTCHLVFGEALAILAGDALQTLAFAELAKISDLPAARVLEMIALLAAAAGGEGMALGQALDLEATGTLPGRAALERIHRRKTGDLIAASVLLGALSTGVAEPAALAGLKEYADHLGLAFQVRDDLLDEEQSTAVLGKPQGANRARGKATYVSLLGSAGARAALAELHERCVQAVAGFGPRAEGLRRLAAYAVQRSH